MKQSILISRPAQYYARHGFVRTARRLWVAMKRGLFSSRMVLFYCDLAEKSLPLMDCPRPLKLECKTCYSELSSQDLEKIVNVWNPNLAARLMKARFSKGASLWLIKSDESLAGYGWTLQGSTIEPHYFPLGRNDVHFFDFHVFPEHRGRGMNPLLVRGILQNLVDIGGRAFIEAAEWNAPQLTSLAKTPFRPFGLAKKWTMFGRTIVCWAGERGAVKQVDGERPAVPAASDTSRCRG